MAAAAARGATRTAAALRDADVYIADVQRVVTSYTALVERLRADDAGARRGDRLPPELKQELLVKRDALKAAFIAKKQAARAQLALAAAAAAARSAAAAPAAPTDPGERRLGELQVAFRAADAVFKGLRVAADHHRHSGTAGGGSASTGSASSSGSGVAATVAGTIRSPGSVASAGSCSGRATRGTVAFRGPRAHDAAAGTKAALLGIRSDGSGGEPETTTPPCPLRAVSPLGVAGVAGSRHDHSRLNGASNDELLDGAAAVAGRTTQRLRDAVAVVVDATDAGRHTAAALEGDRQKLVAIDSAVDGAVEGELAMSRKLVARFAKRIFTDRLVQALTFLVVCGVVAIAVFAALDGRQTAFAVPDAAKPPLPGV